MKEGMTEQERKDGAQTRKMEREKKVRDSCACLTCDARKGEACEGNQSGISVDMTWSHRVRYEQYRLKERAAKREAAKVKAETKIRLRKVRHA